MDVPSGLSDLQADEEILVTFNEDDRLKTFSPWSRRHSTNKRATNSNSTVILMKEPDSCPPSRPATAKHPL